MKRVLLAIVVAACGSMESANRAAVRYTNPTQHYSVDQPDGWTASIERGAARFAPPRDNALEAKHTIVIRSAPKPAAVIEGKPTTNEDLISATSRVLAALPHATLDAPIAVDNTALPGVRFSVTFVPIGTAAKYHRTQITLFGKSHVYHVIYTSPAGETIDEAALKQMVATLEEEG